MKFYPGFDIKILNNPLGFSYGEGTFGPVVENRRLDDIRKSLKNPDCSGPDILYSIAMDVGKEKDLQAMKERNLLYGAVIYASGRIGNEPVRSQGHIHSISKSCEYSTPEVYEIWSGEAVIYMQEKAEDEPGKCFAVKAYPGDVVIVPPSWAHATINSNPSENLVFGAWCVRDYGFEYEGVRRHKGLAWYLVFDKSGKMSWIHNEMYNECDLIIKNPREYKEFGIRKEVPIYTQFEKDSDSFLFVSNPKSVSNLWQNFIP